MPEENTLRRRNQHRHFNRAHLDPRFSPSGWDTLPSITAIIPPIAQPSSSSTPPASTAAPPSSAAPPPSSPPVVSSTPSSSSAPPSSAPASSTTPSSTPTPSATLPSVVNTLPSVCFSPSLRLWKFLSIFS
ncbi:hypothetical protein FA95DRAFT_422098 [Auriscalpium vulgare]|uniref:Uncharacterized protein n=1 Tax=Auriscalpium vulgare TaxID=40419 RepID=A0ACB8S3F0_9AGAM|nr:hypothetical protein FA95DRAFT_422098 [Auriscalpium vulgare]